MWYLAAEGVTQFFYHMVFIAAHRTRRGFVVLKIIIKKHEYITNPSKDRMAVLSPRRSLQKGGGVMKRRKPREVVVV